MLELVQKDQFFIVGNTSEIVTRLREHATRYSTVKELLNDLVPPQEL